MTTAAEVLERIDEELESAGDDAAQASIATLANYGDREQYHDALRKVMSYEALRDLRGKLAEEIEVEQPKPRRGRRKAG